MRVPQQMTNTGLCESVLQVRITMKTAMRGVFKGAICKLKQSVTVNMMMHLLI